MKIVAYIAAGLAGLFLLLVWGMATGPKTYGELAQIEEDRCNKRIRLDGWHGDPEASPQLYCRLIGLAAAQKMLCSEHEEAC
jgi:hypothetical protein